jgi:hypothetical protein
MDGKLKIPGLGTSGTQQAEAMKKPEPKKASDREAFIQHLKTQYEKGKIDEELIPKKPGEDSVNELLTAVFPDLDLLR